MEKQSTHSISADKTDTKQLNTLKRENSKEESNLNMQISRELQEYFKNTEFENLVSPGQSDLTLSGFLNNKLLIVFTIRTGIPILYLPLSRIIPRLHSMTGQNI